MKKRFFQKLSFVLALAMVLSVVSPASSALASKGPSLNSVKKYLHLGREEQGTNEFNFNINNKKSGWKYNWETANEKVATVNVRNGVTVATGVGKTEVSVYITNKDGKEVTTLTAEVIVRDNIEEVTINNPIPGDTLAVGERYNFNRDFVTEAGRTNKTSAITRWTIEPEAGVVLNPNNGVVTPEKAGEYTITAHSFQSKARYNNWVKDSVKYAGEVLDTDTYTFTVGNEMVEAKQVDLSSLNVIFSSAIDKDVDLKDDIEVYAMVGSTKVKQLVKEVKMDDTNKVAKISLYVPFTSGTEYVVEYPEMDSVAFIAATTDAKDVTSMQIVTNQAVVNEATKIEVKLFNADGVDITTDSLLNRVTLESSADVSAYFNGKEITIFQKGVASTITATFHSYEYDATTGQEVGNVTAVGVVMGVDKAQATIGAINAWTIEDAVDKDNKATAPNFDDAKQILAAGDAGKNLFVQLIRKTGNNEEKFNNSQGSEPNNFEFESGDESILIVDSFTGRLYPVKQGTSAVIVKYGVGNDKSIIGAIPIAIGAERKATNFDVTPGVIELSNAESVMDSAEIKITLKDQYGGNAGPKDVKIEKLDGSPAGDLITAHTTSVNGESKIIVNAAGVPDGNYVYRFTMDNMSRIVRIVISKPTVQDKPSYYRLELSGSSVDIAVKSGETDKSVNINLFGYAANGQKSKKVTVSDTAFRVEVINPDGKPVALTGSGFDLVLASATSGSAIVKAKTGNYKVTAYETRIVDNKSVEVAVNVAYFSVTDSQEKPVLAEVKNRLFTATSDIEIAKESFKFTLGGKEITNIIKVDATGTDNSKYIKSVTIREYIDGAFIDHEVNVGYTVNKK